MARKKSNPATKKRRNILPLVPLPTAISQTSEGYQVAKFLRTGKLNAGRRKRGKRNPASEAIEAYTDFHGQEPSEMVKVTTQVHFHRHLAGAGDLKFLVIDTPDKRYRVTLKFQKGTLLAFNEKRNQLFVEGGDQSVDLKLFGIDPNDSHELETLGKATKIGYFTTKVHLAEEDGGTAVYEHKFRMTNQDGQHVTVRIARYPDVIYRVLDEHLEFSGGSYKILPEGIDK